MVCPLTITFQEFDIDLSGFSLLSFKRFDICFDGVGTMFGSVVEAVPKVVD